MNVLDRFLAKVNRTERCWIWNAAVNADGYGRFLLAGANRLAHRVSYELFIGPIPEGLEIDHLCRVRNCVNPEHLEVVTHAVNVARKPLGMRGGRAIQTHCKRGHELSSNNVLFSGKGNRYCRECNRIRSAERQRRVRQEASN